MRQLFLLASFLIAPIASTQNFTRFPMVKWQISGHTIHCSNSDAAFTIASRLSRVPIDLANLVLPMTRLDPLELVIQPAKSPTSNKLNSLCITPTVSTLHRRVTQSSNG